MARLAVHVGDIEENIDSWLIHLRAGKKSAKTLETYGESARQFATYLEQQGMPTAVAHIHREHVEAWIIELIGRWKSTTVNNRYRGVQQLFRWLKEEGLITVSPMENMKPPKVDEVPPDVLRQDQVAALLAVCEADQSFAGRRDAAMIRVFLDTGARRSEVANMRVDDVDFKYGLIYVTGKASASKGPRTRQPSIGAKTAQALDRYIKRARKQHPKAAEPWLWLGHKGRFTPSGVEQIIRRRGREAGIGDIHPHQLRHVAAHEWLLAGGAENSLMALMGWESRTMLQRYAKSAQMERAQAEHKRLGLGDRL